MPNKQRSATETQYKMSANVFTLELGKCSLQCADDTWAWKGIRQRSLLLLGFGTGMHQAVAGA